MKEVIPEMDITFPFQLLWDVNVFRDHLEDQRRCSAHPWLRQMSPSAHHGHPELGPVLPLRMLLRGTGALAAQLTPVVAARMPQSGCRPGLSRQRHKEPLVWHHSQGRC